MDTIVAILFFLGFIWGMWINCSDVDEERRRAERSKRF